jgi:hypothetical protein
MMPGGFFPHKSSSIPPNQQWMSFVADRYTVLLPVRGPYAASDSTLINGPGTNTWATGQPQPCLYPGQFNSLHASLGAFIPAPDGGTTTAQKIMEDSSTNEHSLQANLIGNLQTPLPVWRLAFIWKAAERTRIAYKLIGDQLFHNAYVGFDLVGGQIAYGPTYVNNGAIYWSLSNPTIANLGGGFFLCYVDITTLPAGPAAADYRFIIDSGSGTAAASLSYAGDASGTFGLYGWKSSLLPRGAWKITGYTFQDDFNDPLLGNIDLTNSQQATNPVSGKNNDWFVQPGCNPGFYPAIVTPANKLSAASSVLTIAPSPGNVSQQGGGIATWCQPGALQTPNHVPLGTHVGRGFQPPFLFEARWAYDYPGSIAGGDFSLWFVNLEYIDRVSNFLTVPSVIPINNDVAYIELDPMETQGLSIPYFGPTTGGGVTTGMQVGTGWGGINFALLQPGGADESDFYGMPPYQHAFWIGSGINAYPTGAVVADLGAFYAQSPGPPPTVDPPANPPWSVYTYPGFGGGRPQLSPCFITDFTQLQNYAYMFIPYDRVTGDMGCSLSFFNGAVRTMMGHWAPNMSGANSYIHTVDQHHFGLQINFTGGSQSPTSCYNGFVDYVRIAQ